MPDKKLTDAEIIKALECRVKDKCPECPYFHSYPCDKCRNMQTDALDLINRQKAEIKRLKSKVEPKGFKTAYPMDFCGVLCDFAEGLIAKAKAEAYKECIEKVKEEIAEALESNYKARAEREQSIPIFTENEFWNYCTGKIDCLRGIDDFCDNLLKELVGDNDES